jgi:NTE family protein
MGFFNKKVGLALGSGGGKGITHVGVLKELEANNIKIDYITGCSAGALFGALYATTKSVRTMEKLLNSLDKKVFTKYFYDISLKEGLVKGQKMLDLLGDLIPDDMLIQDTQIPFAVVATDRDKGEKVVIKEGNLWKAVRASMSIPLIFEPVEFEGKILVDGGVSETVPVVTARELGAERVIGVNLNYEIATVDPNKSNVFDVGLNMIDLFCKEIARRDCLNADVTINMLIAYAPLSAFGEDSTPYIEMGRQATRKVMDRIRLL